MSRPILKLKPKPLTGFEKAQIHNEAQQKEARALRKRRQRCATAFTRTLCTCHAVTFNRASPVPFAIGIHKDIRRMYPDVNRAVIKHALHSWASCKAYKDAMIEGADRYALSGRKSGKVLLSNADTE